MPNPFPKRDLLFKSLRLKTQDNSEEWSQESEEGEGCEGCSWGASLAAKSKGPCSQPA